MNIELSQAVAALRDELLEAAREGADHDMSFAVGPIEMEFSVELRADAKAKAGFKAWVVNADVTAGISTAKIHKVKVALTPRQPGGGELLISASDAPPVAPAPDHHIGR